MCFFIKDLANKTALSRQRDWQSRQRDWQSRPRDWQSHQRDRQSRQRDWQSRQRDLGKKSQSEFITNMIFFPSPHHIE